MSLEELTCKMLPNKFPIPICKQIIKQWLLSLDFLHREHSIVHTDLKLDNLLLHVEDMKCIPSLETSETSAIDLSCIFLRPSAVVTSELGVASKIEKVYFWILYGLPVNIWNLGCLAFELMTYCWLFNPPSNVSMVTK
ncbi:uncharacterized protein EV420DRAFT_1650509 [Desarmillaria tabescens]|uniref:non-specific serine/threonine protein kinase n=1 Tax=Armillaria tabescens TaxID=1929756 RepID=A0AA39JHA1_ARMTA|nr:uncharacterized protein EV420DRAFT_1650509 [Desarmillaria tabescens]KAK0440488.1 hypothetical protein EV420DRAFT_1650509 [Desarmillaria tabescens]